MSLSPSYTLSTTAPCFHSASPGCKKERYTTYLLSSYSCEHPVTSFQPSGLCEQYCVRGSTPPLRGSARTSSSHPSRWAVRGWPGSLCCQTGIRCYWVVICTSRQHVTVMKFSWKWYADCDNEQGNICLTVFLIDVLIKYYVGQCCQYKKAS